MQYVSSEVRVVVFRGFTVCGGTGHLGTVSREDREWGEHEAQQERSAVDVVGDGEYHGHGRHDGREDAEVAAEAVDLLDGQHVPVADVGQRVGTVSGVVVISSTGAPSASQRVSIGRPGFRNEIPRRAAVGRAMLSAPPCDRARARSGRGRPAGLAVYRCNNYCYD